MLYQISWYMFLLIQLKKADYCTKIGEFEKKNSDQDQSYKYNTIQEFNKLTANNFAARSKQASL